MKWLLLILSLPTENAAARMRAWRALKAAGAAVLRDGVYLLPDGMGTRAGLAAVAADVTAAGGHAWLLETETAAYPFVPLFDRTEDYRRLVVDLDACRDAVAASAAPDSARLAKKLRRGFEALAAIDFFPGEARRQVEARLDELDARIRAKAAPDEPSARASALRRRAAADYAGRLWATRKRPWVDRLACAWLIRRFIDPAARFIWLERPIDCPAEAVGFDFDGATFSHAGDQVSFETLMDSFGLAADPALARIARIVHYLDVGGLPVPEAAGLEALLAGMRASIADDDALSAAAAGAFDFLYLADAADPVGRPSGRLSP